LTAVALGLSALFPVASAHAAPDIKCDVPSLQAIAPADTEVTFAVRRGARATFTTCQVYGYVTTRDPGPNRIPFVLALPKAFNGRFLYIGVGGAGGYLPDMPNNLLLQGYAIAGSDNGSGAQHMADFQFMADPAKKLDFQHRALHVTARVAQQMTKAYYGTETLHRYMTGCSGGGAMGLQNIYYHGGTDFDGIIVGANTFHQDAYIANMGRIAQHLQRHPEGWISPDLLKKAQAAIIEAYDTTDGARDGIIHDDRNIKNFDTGLLRRVGFTDAQIGTFNLIRSPYRYKGAVKPPSGALAGFSINLVSAWPGFLTGTSPPPWKSVAEAPVAEIIAGGAPYIHAMSDTLVRANVDPKLYYVTGIDYMKKADLDKLSKGLQRVKPFQFDQLVKDGGKFIYYHGVGDQSVPYLEAVENIQTIYDRYPNGRSWARLFTVPGMFHCYHGPGPEDAPDQLLGAMAAWVENGTPPESVVARRHDPSREFLLCAYPNREMLKAGATDPMKAESWECGRPPQ
jgi:feruloyl esterase